MALSLAGLLASAHGAPRASVRGSCCALAAGTPVEVELVDRLSTKLQKRGDSFALRLAAPVIVDGMIVLPVGTPGVGKVIDSSGPGLGGKPGAMVLAAEYLRTRSGRVALNALHLAGRGHDNSTPSTLLEIGGIVSAPAGIVGIILPGGDVAFNAGTIAEAQVASPITLPALGRASRRQIAQAAAVNAHAAADVAAEDASAIPIPPPPPGEGQVVFFRAKTLLGTAQWFNVREDGKALGKLDNGAYFIKVEPPGVHNFTAKLEPELKDRLKLQIDAGQTYFVEGTLTAGLIISAADLVPSSVDKFNAAAKHLKLASAPKPDVQSASDQTQGEASAIPTPKPVLSSGGASAGPKASSAGPPS